MERMARIARNEQYLASLGLATKQKKRQGPRKEPRTKAPRTEARRRSSRLAPIDKEPVEKPKVVEYDESAAAALLESGEPLVGRRRLEDPSLKGIYALAVAGPVIAAGGKNGRVALFGSELVSSFRGCNGWIGGLCFVDNKLLCCGNDGGVHLWDARLEPARRDATLKVHSSGAWTLARRDDVVATGGKDGALSVMQLSSFQQLHSLEASDAGSVKGVAFVSAHVVATAGDDGSARLFDLRSDKETLRIDAHSRATSVCPVPNDGGLLTGGLDHALKLWDLRQPLGPATSYDAFPAHIPRRGIRHPEFVSSRAFCIAGDTTASLSVFDIDGTRIHHRSLDSDATALAAIPNRENSLSLALALTAPPAVDLVDLDAASSM